MAEAGQSRATVPAIRFRYRPHLLAGAILPLRPLGAQTSCRRRRLGFDGADGFGSARLCRDFAPAALAAGGRGFRRRRFPLLLGPSLAAWPHAVAVSCHPPQRGGIGLAL